MTEALVTIEAIRAAAARIANIAIKTPLIRAPFPGLSGHGTPKEIYLKAESLQPIGAFKIRGAANKILQLSPEEIARGVITYSSGNHAQGVAYAAREVGAKAVIVMPSNAPAIKRAAILAMGAEIVDVGVASSERLAKSDELVRKHGYVVIPPYDDEQIITGQATCGLEIIESLPAVDLVLAPVSGGGLLSGVAAAVKQLSPRTKVYGVEPELAGDTAESFRTGSIVTWPAELTSRTLADGLRTQSVGERNFAHIQAFVDGIITVTEPEIRAAMRAIVAATRLVPEPSGAVAAAALLFHASELPAYSTAVAVVSGGNVDPALLAQILSEK
jgi:threonine dehydratase